MNWLWLKTLGNIEFYSADIKNYDDIYVIIKNFLPDTIFHVAGQVAMTSSIINPMRDFSTNVIGSINILEAVRLISPNTTILYASTNKVYGDRPNKLNLKEEPKRYQLEDDKFNFSIDHR